MQALSDSAIILMAKDGDTQAFRILVERHQSMLFALASQFLGKDDAEDAVQEVFIRFWKNLHKYRPKVKLTTWLYRIMTNFCLDQLKSKERKKWFRMIDINKTYTVQNTSAPDTQLEHKELMQYILKIADNLTPKQRSVFILRDLEGLPVTEVCNILSMKASRVKGNLYHARRKIHNQLVRHYDLTKKQVIL